MDTNVTNTNTKIDLISALQNSAMLCGLKTKALGLQRTHNGASVEVTTSHQATNDAATVRVNRLAGADSHHRKITQLQNNMRRVFEQYTLPWDGIGGWRMLPNVNFIPLLKAIHPIDAKIKTTIAELVTKAPEIIEAARRSLGTLAADITLPTVEEINTAYMAKMEYGSIPDTSALKNLPDNVVSTLSTLMQNRAQLAYNSALQDIQERVATPMRHLIERLQAFEEREGREAPEGTRDLKGVFRDATVTNIIELSKTLPNLNVLGDAHTREIVDSVVDLANNITAEGLRASPDTRENAKAKAQNILAAMGY